MRVPYWAAARFSGNHLYDLTQDPGEENNLAGSGLEKDMAALLREALKSVDAPEEQFARLGLALRGGLASGRTSLSMNALNRSGSSKLTLCAEFSNQRNSLCGCREPLEEAVAPGSPPKSCRSGRRG